MIALLGKSVLIFYNCIATFKITKTVTIRSIDKRYIIYTCIYDILLGRLACEHRRLRFLDKRTPNRSRFPKSCKGHKQTQ